MQEKVTLYGQYLIIDKSSRVAPSFELYFIRHNARSGLDFVGEYKSFTDAAEATLPEYR